MNGIVFATNLFDQFLAVNWSIVLPVSLITSFIFLLFMALIRPIVTVSKNILWSWKTVKNANGQEEKQKYFKIKVVNWTMANLYEIRIQLSLVSRYGDGDSTFSVRYTDIPFKKSEFMFIPSMVWKQGRRFAEYAQIFISYEDIEKIWNDDSQYIEFRMSAKHGLSGFNKVIIKQFTDKDVIKEGRFKYGTSRKCK